MSNSLISKLFPVEQREKIDVIDKSDIRIDCIYINTKSKKIRVELFVDSSNIKNFSDNYDATQYDGAYLIMLIGATKIKCSDFSLDLSPMFQLLQNDDNHLILKSIDNSCILTFKEWVVIDSGPSEIDFKKYYY